MLLEEFCLVVIGCYILNEHQLEKVSHLYDFNITSETILNMKKTMLTYLVVIYTTLALFI